jgi:hypothetical protein
VIPRTYALAGPAYLAALLAVDTQVGRGGQYALGALTWLVLVGALLPLPGLARAQALGVVLFATVGEVTGSLIWGVYRYRLHNLPLFVPPAHGLVYLTGYSLAHTRLVRRFPRPFVAVALAGALAWGALGLSGALGRVDAIGFFGVCVFASFLLLVRPRATVLAGVFCAVAALELYGTALGTWRWHAIVPGLGLPDGNPPSGAVSGYVIFDLVAFALAPRLQTWAARISGRPRPAGVSAS